MTPFGAHATKSRGLRGPRLFAFLVCAIVASAACDDGTEPAPSDTRPGQLVRSSKPRLTASAPAADTHELTSDDAAFGFDVLEKAGKNDNAFISPHSISIALAMTYGGAREQTAAQMAKALRFTLPNDRLHAAFGSLDVELGKRGTKAAESGKPFTLRIENSIWGQKGYAFLPAYLDLLAEHYGAGLSLLDFASDPEASRSAINGWVSARTERRIPELIPPGVVTRATVLVLTNAIYFNASWKERFEPSATTDGTFTKLDGATVTTRFMHQTKQHSYAEGDGWQAVRMPYVGEEVSMIVLLPAAGTFSKFVGDLDGAKLGTIVQSLGTRSVDVTLPRFSFRTQLAVKPILQELGMLDAFQGGVADFSGMDGTKSLFIQDVVHEAFVSVDENGTEAAAATAVVVGRTSAPERATFAADRPFVFVIRDDATGAVLFAGQVTSP